MRFAMISGNHRVRPEWLFVLAVFCFASETFAQRDLFSDTWVATDALGRELPGHEQCGPVRQGKTVLVASQSNIAVDNVLEKLKLKNKHKRKSKKR